MTVNSPWRISQCAALAATLLIVGTTQKTYADVLARWDVTGFVGGAGNFNVSPLAPTSTDADATVGGLTRGAGIGTSGTGANNAWGGSSFRISGSSFTTAIDDAEYASFTIKANAGQALSLSGFDAYNVRHSGTGPSMGQWQYSTNGSSFIDIGGPITWGSNTTSAGNTQTPISLSDVSALQNLADTSTVTFRVALWGATNTGGTWYINDPTGATTDFVLNGTTAPVGSTTFAGDYNGDAVVDAGDYVTWRRAQGDSTLLTHNETVTPGVADAADYDAWRASFGNSQTVGGGSGLSGGALVVPEPAPAIPTITALLAAGCLATRKRKRPRTEITFAV